MAPARRAAANVEAPVWKSYLAARMEQAEESATTAKATAMRSRKRPKPSTANHTAGSSGADTRVKVRGFWEALTVQERMQILFVDDPELVKQLYKLNLSLLCVGLMQRHLKAGRASTTTTTPAITTAPVSTTTSTASTTAATTTTATATSNDISSSSERTYDLLEAMEFMDIGTGLLTVKTELVEDVERTLSLLSSVLPGVLTSLHLLGEVQFQALFVDESEVINTWDDYERLIAMLVEQLMLRGYVAHLEREATQQMEALLLEDSVAQTQTQNESNNSKTKKKKPKKKDKKPLHQPHQHQLVGAADAGTPTHQRVGESDAEPDPELSAFDFACSSECSTEDADLPSGPSSPVKSMTNKGLYALNPHAQAFEPSTLSSLLTGAGSFVASGKRKLDDFIIHIPWQDAVDSDDEPLDEYYEQYHDREPSCRRRRDEDAELRLQLEHIYASTSSLLGWDCNEQPALEPWSDAALFRTTPRDVVRYYFPPPPPPPSGYANSTGSWPPRPLSAPPSRYYFTPPLAPPQPSTSVSGAATASVYPGFLSPPAAPVSFWDATTTL